MTTPSFLKKYEITPPLKGMDRRFGVMGNYILTPDGELYHHGIKGMKWGVRRYQNKDGSLTPAGKKFVQDITDELQTNYKKQLSSSIAAIKAAKEYMDFVDELDEQYYKSDACKKDRQRAYDETLALFKKDDPDALASMISKNGGRSDNLDKFYDFDTTMDYYLDRAWSDGLAKVYRKNGLSSDAWMESRGNYQQACKAASESVVGKYGNMKISDATTYYKSTVDLAIRESLIDMAWRTEETARRQAKTG